MRPTRWDVVWCYEVPNDENGDGDLFAAKYETRGFASEAEALAFAEKLLAQRADYFGAVRVRPVARVSWTTFREDCDMETWVERGEPWGLVGREREVSDSDGKIEVYNVGA